jgi:hypothetical protein
MLEDTLTRARDTSTGAQFTLFTSTKVQTLAQIDNDRQENRAEHLQALLLSLLALLVQRYK